MILVPATRAHALELQGWFADEAEARAWGGPAMRYPFNEQAFLEDIHWGEMPTWASEDSAGQLNGFGQYYPRNGRCHLARLVVDPEARGEGLGRRFILELMRLGQSEYGNDGFSLFVMADNTAAVQCYTHLGFKCRDWPQDATRIDGCLYLERGTL